MSTASAFENRPVGPWIPEWSLGDRFRKVRRETGLTQRQFATLIGFPEPRYAAWEADRAIPPNVVSIAKAIQLATSVPAAWILGVDGDPTGSASEQSGEPTDYNGDPEVISIFGRGRRTSAAVTVDGPLASVTTLPTAVER